MNNYDFPEAETMETRKAYKTQWSGARIFWGVAFGATLLMFLGNWIMAYTLSQ